MLGLSDRDMEALRKGTWELPCLSMELRRRDGKYVFSGSGIVRQNERREVVFTLLDSQQSGGLKNVFEELNKPDLSAGQIIPEGHYYELRAIDNSENTWCSVPTLNVSPAYGPSNGAVVSGTIRELRRSENLSEYAIQRAKDKNEPAKPFYDHSCWNYYCFGEVGCFPCNAGVEKSTHVAGRETRQSSSMSVSRAESDAFIFELQKDDGVVQFSIQGKDGRSYPDNTELRFVEALQFVLGRPFDWEVMEIFHGNAEEVRIRPLPTEQPRARMWPPLALKVHEYCNEFWELYRKYLAYILSFSESGWHPISRRVFTLQHGMADLWPIKMLTAGVEVEGLLKDAFSISAKCETELKKMAAKSVVRLPDVRAWGHVRNNATHAVASETELSQDNALRLYKILVLFYHLIFRLIGYAGKYTDYGELLHPTRTYPP